MAQKFAPVLGGFCVGYWFLSESLINHSQTSIVSKEDFEDQPKLIGKILKRHDTMKKWLNVDMTHAKRVPER